MTKENNWVKENWKSIEEMVEYSNPTKDFCVRLESLLTQAIQEDRERIVKALHPANKVLTIPMKTLDGKKEMDAHSYAAGYGQGISDALSIINKE